MKYALAPLAFTLGASAAALKRSQCCFDLTASGGVSGTVGQLTDGQNRIGGGYSPTSFCLSNGGITDSNGRGCIVTNASGQFQCDEGKAPTTGFSVGSNGTLTFNGKAQFYGCPAADDQDNIYTRPVQGQEKCVPVMLSTSGQCSSSSGGQGTPSGSATPAYTPSAYSTPGGGVPQSSIPAASPPYPYDTPQPSPGVFTSPAPAASQPSGPATPVTPVPSVESSAGGGSAPTPVVPNTPGTPYAGTPYAGTPSVGTPYAGTPYASSPYATPAATPAGACPTNLAGDYQYPHLIVPINSSTPSTAYGTQYNGTLDSSTCTTYNFDIPTNYTGSTCTLEFLFPHQEELETSAFEFSAGDDDSVEFSALTAPVDQSTSWDTVPAVQSVYGSWPVRPGNGYVLASGTCKAGQTFGVKACSKGGLELNYFQDWNPSPIGLFVRRC
ncbi:ubiquitin 3 binding protein But2 C-terminal domain-containing protein [Phyllosticta capitalensis]|uniref:Ubiquitin 3 binding protein But2 C-terminal domain-containing protein n=1 Tax=Phyllosticta capitalensis TaxID=121624 RepID=A0ABR1YCE1_9PEZI